MTGGSAPDPLSPAATNAQPKFNPGAEPISLDGGPRSALVLHGFGDTPQSVRGLATFLHANGWTVRAPALAGHGSTLSALTAARAHDWLAGTRRALEELHARSKRVAVVGQSMGGALAVIAAAEARVDALVLLVPFLRLSPRGAAIAAFHPLVSLFSPYLQSRSESSILDPAARRNALGRGVATPRLLHELSVIVRQAREASSRVRAPTLVVHSRQDPRITPKAAEAGFASLGASPKRLEWVEHSGHVISVDYDRDWVAARTLAWLETYVTPDNPELTSIEPLDD
jgi:carboxylesterase